jgi:LacI family transcriptional regulator
MVTGNKLFKPESSVSMGRIKATVTIRDVAKAAGVSVSTVSRVLNDKDDVAPETYSRVKAVIEEMGYASNLAAKSMRSRATNVVGLIMPDVGDPFSIEVMKGVNRAIAPLDYDLIVYTTGDFKKNTWADNQRRFVALLNNSITDGVVVVTPSATDFPTAAPVVAVDPNRASPDLPAVIATNHIGALSAMEYLIGLGHRRIGFIGGRTDLQSGIQRRQGYEDALRQAGLPVDPDLIQDGDFTTETAVFCARRLLSLPDPPTAIFAANDQSAFGVVSTARELGAEIPDDLSVVGFDNIPDAAYSQPALTTVDQFVAEMGYAAVELLMNLMQGNLQDSNQITVSTQLVIRDSCRAI